MPLWCALAFLVRPDAVTLFLTGSAAAVWVAGSAGRERRAVLWAILAGLLLIAGVLAFQKWYYGYWFPNTYYLKASADTRQFGRGLKYVAKFALQEFQLAFLLAPLLYLVGGLRSRETRPAYLPAAVILGAWVCYIVWVGGDVFYFSRFWAPIIPMLTACTVFLLCRWRAEATGFAWKKAAAAVVIALLGLQLAAEPFRVRSAVEGNKDGVIPSVRYAVALGQSRLPPDTIIGVFLAGAMPYFMPGTEFHDFLGKCDTHIAHSPAHWGPPGHNKWDFAYSLGVVRPRYIIADSGYADADPAQTDALMRQEVRERKDFGFHPSLWLDPLFRRDYVRTTYLVDGRPVRGQDIYARKTPQ